MSFNQPPKAGEIFLDIGRGPYGTSATLGDEKGSVTISGDASMSTIQRRFSVRLDDLKRAIKLHEERTP